MGFGAVVPSAGMAEALSVLDWSPFIIELALVAKVLCEHEQQLRSCLGYLWAARPSWTQLRTRPEAWAFFVLQVRRVYTHTLWMRGFYDWCVAWWSCVLQSWLVLGCPDLVPLPGALLLCMRRRPSC